MRQTRVRRYDVEENDLLFPYATINSMKIKIGKVNGFASDSLVSEENRAQSMATQMLIQPYPIYTSRITVFKWEKCQSLEWFATCRRTAALNDHETSA